MLVCDIYASNFKNEMYLYVARQDGVERVPEELLVRLGELRLVTTVLLKPGLKLARVDVFDVMSSLDRQGYYLQMPPGVYRPDQNSVKVSKG